MFSIGSYGELKDKYTAEHSHRQRVERDFLVSNMYFCKNMTSHCSACSHIMSRHQNLSNILLDETVTGNHLPSPAITCIAPAITCIAPLGVKYDRNH